VASKLEYEGELIKLRRQINKLAEDIKQEPWAIIGTGRKLKDTLFLLETSSNELYQAQQTLGSV
jgi:hypothetical protein